MGFRDWGLGFWFHVSGIGMRILGVGIRIQAHNLHGDHAPHFGEERDGIGCWDEDVGW